MALSDFDLGYIMGLMVGEGSFTGDKEQPALQLRLKDDDPEPLKRLNRLLGGNIYGPYNHSERRYYVWMLRGAALWKATELFNLHLPNSRKRRQFLEWWQKYAKKLPPLPPDITPRLELQKPEEILENTKKTRGSHER
jgi:hypothetical protein